MYKNNKYKKLIPEVEEVACMSSSVFATFVVVVIAMGLFVTEDKFCGGKSSTTV